MARFKSAMRKYCHSKKKSCVIFERNFKSQHLQLQVLGREVEGRGRGEVGREVGRGGGSGGKWRGRECRGGEGKWRRMEERGA